MDTKIYGSAWYSPTQKYLRTTLTIGYTEYILSPQEWEKIAHIANKMLNLHATDLKPEEIEELTRSVLTVDPSRKPNNNPPNTT